MFNVVEAQALPPVITPTPLPPNSTQPQAWCYCNVGGYCTASGSGYVCGSVWGGSNAQCGIASGSCPTKVNRQP